MGGVTRREIDELTELAKRFGAKGLVHLAVAAGRRAPRPDREVPVARDAGGDPSSATGATEGDLVLVVADARETTNDVLGRLRVELGGRLGLADPAELAYCWVHRFPMYKWDAEHGRWDATHNPFSGVVPEDEALLDDDVGRASTTATRRTIRPAGPARCSTTSRSTAGSWAAARCGSGSRDLLARSFNLQGYSLEQMQERFGAMLEAFEYGAPPHGGIALGIDRWAALLSRPDEHPRGHGVPQDAVGLRPRCSRRRRRPSEEQYEELGLRFVGVPERR